MGAQLRSLSSADGHAYLWSGDPSVWAGTAPVLFPFVGKLNGDEYHFAGARYPMEKHGFARNQPFDLLEHTPSSVVLRLQHSPATLAVYPFPFRLDVRFSLDGNCLSAEHSVTNIGDAPCFFSLGAHPGFRCDMGDELVFSHPETPETYRLVCGSPVQTTPMLTDARVWPITSHAFDDDAYILVNPRSESIELRRAHSPHHVHFFFHAPYLGIWAKPGAPYVCLEPWLGVDDFPQHDGDLTRKRGIQQLAPGETCTLTYGVQCL